MTRRKWMLVGALGGIVIVLVSLAAVGRVSGRLGRYAFLRGADLVNESETVYDSGSTRTLTTHRVYALHADFDQIGPAIDAELKANGWVQSVATPTRYMRFYTRVLPPSPPSGKGTPGRIVSGGFSFVPGAGAIIITRGRPYAPSDPHSAYSSYQEPGWLIVSVHEPPRELGWIDSVIEKLTPSSATSKRTTVRLGKSGAMIVLPATGATTPVSSSKP